VKALVSGLEGEVEGKALVSELEEAGAREEEVSALLPETVLEAEVDTARRLAPSGVPRPATSCPLPYVLPNKPPHLVWPTPWLP